MILWKPEFHDPSISGGLNIVIHLRAGKEVTYADQRGIAGEGAEAS
jgi:hypothetical protein